MIDEPKLINAKPTSNPYIHATNIPWLHRLDSLLPEICVVLGIVLGVSLIGYIVISGILMIIHRRQLLAQEVVYLELTPPVTNNKMAEATETFFAVLHGLASSRSMKDNLLTHKLTLALELISSRERGIRYIIRVSKDEAPIVEQQLTSYLPDVQVARIDDPLPPDLNWRKTRLLHFKQSGHPALPLNTEAVLAQHDPISYITGSLTQLASGELMALQLVITPTVLREASTISAKAMNSEDLLAYLSRRKLVGWNKVFHLTNTVLFGMLALVGEIFNGGSGSSYGSSSAQRDAHDRIQIAKRQKPAHYVNPFEQELVESVHDKVSQPLFYTSLRAAIVTETAIEAKTRARAVKSSLASFNVPHYQGLRSKRHLLQKLLKKRQLRSFSLRLPEMWLRRSMVLSSSEIAALYHFPRRQVTQTENIVKSLSRTLPAPLSLKQGGNFDVVLGRNNHHGVETDIGLTIAERERHVYIIGGTGNGKTTMLLYAMVQDVQRGKGIAVIDPHGDLAETVLKYIPEDRVDDVIYFNPDDYGYPIGLNLLELPEGLSGDELLREKDLITETVVSVFRKIFSDDDSGGHRIEYVLRNTIQTALTIDGANIFTIFRLLANAKYRKSIVKTLDDADLKDFWNNELGKAGEFQRVKMSAGITAKIGRFLFSASAKRILEQPKSTIDFDDIINSGKILICNFSKGLLGEDTSGLFGITVLAKIQIATLRRARLQQVERHPFYLYADEFQNFATISFVQLLSEARKYKLFLLMAEQSTSQQQEQRMVNIILANVGTIICFRSGNPADEKLLLPMFAPYIEAGEIAYLPSFHFYMRIAAVNSQEPLSGETVLLDNQGSSETAKLVINKSRASHGAHIEEVSEPTAATDLIPSPNSVEYGVGLPD